MTILTYSVCMWLRRYTLNMGLDHEEFTKAFLVALSDEAIVNKMKDILCGNLQFQTDKLNEANSNLGKQLNSFREINTQLQKEVTEL